MRDSLSPNEPWWVSEFGRLESSHEDFSTIIRDSGWLFVIAERAPVWCECLDRCFRLSKRSLPKCLM